MVVGGGVGGLACAIDLRRQGVRVTLLERGAAVGGKIRQEQVDGRAIDAGPTVLTMRWVFEGLFADAGAALAEAVTLQPLTVLARHAWADGSRLDLHADAARSAEAIAAFAGAAEARGFVAFCRHAEEIYRLVAGPFIRSSRPTLPGLIGSLGLRGLKGVLTVDWHRSMWRALGDFFKDPRLRQLFGRYATYYGSDPFTAPATLNLIAHVEQAGVWSVQGGMIALAAAMEGLARGLGVEIRCGAEAGDIEARGRGLGVVVGDGALAADAVVLAGDVAAAAEGRHGAACARAVAAPAKGRRSLSAVTWAAVAETSGWPLVRHNVCFSADYAREFKDLAAGRLPADPTVYVCAQDRGDGQAFAGGPERLLILVNAPARGGEGCFTVSEIEACQRATVERLRRCGLTIRLDPSATTVTTPDTFAARFPGTGGALYGAATRGWTDSLARPGARTKLPGLYLAGGSVHPGAGVPMATLSGRYAAAAICEDLRSTAGFRPADTRGGTSTRSATTGATG
ncbi:MAG: phytoene desaturase [Myxococcales bacterium]|nr:phytoene desaturase [Myxococcales bacterium]